MEIRNVEMIEKVGEKKIKIFVFFVCLVREMKN